MAGKAVIWAGILRLLLRTGVKLQPMVFCHHTADRDALTSQVRFLIAVLRTVPLSRIRDAGPNTIAFTLDDGRVADVDLWNEITSRFHVPLTIFVPVTHHKDGAALWSDQVKRLLEAGSECTFAGRRYGTSTAEQSERALQAVIDAVYHSAESTAEVEEGFTNALREVSADVDPRYRVITPERLTALLSNRYLSVGSHTMTHAFLARTPPKDLERELAESGAYLKERYSERYVPCLCYPYGSRELVGDLAMDRVRDHYSMAVLLDGHAIGDDPYTTGRIGLYEKDTPSRILLKIVRAQLSVVTKARRCPKAEARRCSVTPSDAQRR